MITFDLFEGEDRDRIRDTVTKAAIIKARARHPAATSDIEALAQDMIDTQKHDEQELEKAQEVNVRQDELLKQIRALDRRQDSEIDQVEDEENSLEQKIELLRAANEKLAQTVANMRSRKKNAEVKLDESGPEIWTVHFTDGSTAKIRVPSDETDPALVRKHFAKQGRTVAKFDYGFDQESETGPGPEAHEPGSGTAVSGRTGEPLPEDMKSDLKAMALAKIKQALKDPKLDPASRKDFETRLQKIQALEETGMDTFNRGGHNKLRDKNDYYDKREHLAKQLDTPGYSYADRQSIRDRMMQLEKAARMQGFIK